MRKTLVFLVACFVFVDALPAQEKPFRPEITPKILQPLMDATWYGMYLKDKKIGWAHEDFEKTRDDRYREFLELHMKLTSFGKRSEVVIQENRYYETKPPFRLMDANLVQKDGKQTSIVRLQRMGDKMLLTIQANKVSRKRKLPSLNYTLADSIAVTLWMRSTPKVGAKIKHRSLDLFEGATNIKTSKVLSKKSGIIGGVKLKYYEVEGVGKQGKFLSRHNADGEMLSGKIGQFDLRREPEKLAKKTEFSGDLFLMGLTKIDEPLGEPTDVTALAIKVDGKGAAALKSGPRQEVFRNDSDQAIVLVGEAWTKPVKATAKEIEENSKDTTRYPIRDPKIQSLMKRAIGDAKTPQEKIKNITQFVYLFVEPKLTGIRPDIHELLDKKEGDCKSYALLLTTLARAAGIPARTVGGLMYMGDDERAFAGHAWNEVVLDGEWVPIDASLNETEINATHIRDEELLDTLGNLSFQLIRVKHRK